MKLSDRDRNMLSAIAREGQISTSLANPPVMGLAKKGLVRFKYRSEDLNIIEITDLGRAALSPQEASGKGGERG